jgi:hypothetical protein
VSHLAITPPNTRHWLRSLRANKSRRSVKGPACNGLSKAMTGTDRQSRTSSKRACSTAYRITPNGEEACATAQCHACWPGCHHLDEGYCAGTPAQRSGFSCRLAALANATQRRAGSDSKTQKSSDLARRKAVSYNPLLARAVVGYV